MQERSCARKVPGIGSDNNDVHDDNGIVVVLRRLSYGSDRDKCGASVYGYTECRFSLDSLQIAYYIRDETTDKYIYFYIYYICQIDVQLGAESEHDILYIYMIM